MSPTVYEFAGLKVKIHARDHNPPHVHVVGKGCEARFRLEDLELLSNDGFSRADIRKIVEALKGRALSLQEIWDEYQR